MLKLEHKVSSEQINSTLRAVVLEENPAQLPNEEELRLYAGSLGINPDTESNLLWIAREGISASLPKGWQVLQDENNQIFYYNTQTGMSLWEHPLDAKFRERVRLARCYEDRKSKRAGDGDKENKLPLPCNGEPSPGTEFVASVNNLLSSTEEKSCDAPLRTPVQQVSGTGKQFVSSPVIKEYWKNTPLLGEEVPGADGLASPSGDTTDTPTEYCNFTIPSSCSAHSRRSIMLLGANTKGGQSPSAQSTVACQTRSDNDPEFHSSAPPSSGTKTFAAKHFADLDQADRRLTKLRDSIRRDYLLTATASGAPAESPKCVSFSPKLVGMDRLLLEKSTSRPFTMNSSSTPAMNSTRHHSQHGEHNENYYDSPTPALRYDTITCPTLGKSPSDLSTNNHLEERVLQQLQSICVIDDFLKNTRLSPVNPEGSSTNNHSSYCDVENPTNSRISDPSHRVPPSKFILPAKTCQHSSNCSSGTVVNVRHLVSPEVPVVQVASPTASNECGLTQPSKQEERRQSLLAVNDAFGHLLEERSRLERKLLRLRLIYKTYKQRMTNLDASIKLLQKNTVSPVDKAVNHRHITIYADSDDHTSEKSNHTYRGQVSILLADQVSELGSRHKEDGSRASPLCVSAPRSQPVIISPCGMRSSLRSLSVPRYSTLLKESAQSCSCCQSSRSHNSTDTCTCGCYSSRGTTPFGHHLARMTSECDRQGRKQRKSCNNKRTSMLTDDNINLLTSLSPEPAAGVFRQPLLETSPTWQQSD